MAQETPKYPQVTPEQVQLWESDPVTKVFMQCLGWFKADVIEDAGTGANIDSSCADLNHATIHLNLGQQQGLSTAMDYPNLFDRFGMILLPEPEEEEDA